MKKQEILAIISKIIDPDIEIKKKELLDLANKYGDEHLRYLKMLVEIDFRHAHYEEENYQMSIQTLLTIINLKLRLFDLNHDHNK